MSVNPSEALSPTHDVLSVHSALIAPELTVGGVGKMHLCAHVGNSEDPSRNNVVAKRRSKKHGECLVLTSKWRLTYLRVPEAEKDASNS